MMRVDFTDRDGGRERSARHRRLSTAPYTGLIPSMHRCPLEAQL